MPTKYKTRFPMETFLRRFNQVLQTHNLSHADFDKLSGMNTRSRWKKGKAINLDTLLYIGRHFQVSLDWLLDHRLDIPELPGVHEAATAPYQPKPTEINESLLAETLAVVSEYLKKFRHKLTLRQAAALVARLYFDCSRDLTKPTYLMVERNLLFVESMTS